MPDPFERHSRPNGCCEGWDSQPSRSQLRRIAVTEEAADDEALASLVAALTARRESLGLTIAHVAGRMQVAHGTVAALERGEADPRLSVLQQYARAVGLRLAVDIEAEDRP